MARVVADPGAGTTLVLRDEAEAIERERRFLAEIVGQWRDKQEQKRARNWAIWLGAFAGFVLFPVFAAVAPGSSFLTAFATGHADR